jgi:DHA1 family tetracycline resistance protein-like MFS transporter
MGAAFGFGFIIGPTIGGILGEPNLRLPFIAAAGLAAVNWLYGLFVLPESLPPEKRTTSMAWGRANPLGSLAFLRARGELLGMSMVSLLFQLSFTVLPAIFVLYTNYRFGWSVRILGYTFLATGVSQMIVQAVLVGPVVRRVGERGAILLGSSAGVAAFLIYALAPNGWVYLCAIPVWAMTGFLQPGLMGLMSKRVDPSHQGQLQGALQSLQGIASFIGPAMYGLIFAWAVRHDATLHLPGLPILISAALMAGALALALAVAKPPTPALAPAPAA